MKKNIQKSETGLVIGKFYPPHKGHKFLIDTALKNSEKVFVIVCYKNDESIPGELRAKWIREIHPEAEVLLVDDDLTGKLTHSSPEEISKAWAEYTVQILGFSPDAVYTSEEYGARYAKFMGAKHVLADKERVKVPISATKIRKNPLLYWEYLLPPVRAYFTKRITVVGAESTGTTTMAKALAEHYKTSWVPEYGRTYWEGKLNSPEASIWRTGEFIHIADMQNKMEDDLARTANKILICDTDSFATTLWHERYMKFLSPEVEKLSSNRKYDLYLLTDIDIPFVQDGTRDGENIRAGMHQRFIAELKKNKKPFVLLSGSHEARLEKAAKECDKVLSKVVAH
ncbi:MAG: AAA family ATPase [bacterium]|nr:AAA family ATPase [bacterium]